MYRLVLLLVELEMQNFDSRSLIDWHVKDNIKIHTRSVILWIVMLVSGPVSPDTTAYYTSNRTKFLERKHLDRKHRLENRIIAMTNLINV